VYIYRMLTKKGGSFQLEKGDKSEFKLKLFQREC